MKIKIYDYANTLTEIETIKEIEKICVRVISGDEIVDICYEDGTMETYDSCPDSRVMNFDDGFYTVEKEQIEEWNNIKCDEETYSYKRMNHFWYKDLKELN